MGRLYYLNFDGVPGESWEISDRPLVVGRGETADGVVADASLSRSHFMVVQEGGHDLLVDLESRNGTAVDGEPVAGRRLAHGAMIRAGNSLFYYSQEASLEHLPGLTLPVTAGLTARVPAVGRVSSASFP
jgi:pSer/pThr/pTyr-binding forkhead associated (FHA) protein